MLFIPKEPDKSNQQGGISVNTDIDIQGKISLNSGSVEFVLHW